MSSSPHQTVLVPVGTGLGSASSYNRTIFPLSSYRKRDSVGRGDLYLDATLDEMLKITNIGPDPKQWEEFIDTTKARYDRLMLQKSELEQRPKSWNLYKIYTNYRAARFFLAASKSLYFATKSRSEEMLRTISRNQLSIRVEDVQLVNGDVPPDVDSNVKGIAVRLDRPLDDAMKQQLLDAANTIASCPGPFKGDQSTFDASSFLSTEYFLASESLTSLASLGATEETLGDTVSPLPSPSSSMTINNFYSFQGLVYSSHSNVYGATVQIDGTGNSGSATHTITPPNTT